MAMNPLNHTIFHGIIGFVIHAGFWCMMLVYLNIANTKINLDKLDNILIIVLIIETILTSIQYNLPPGHILNRYAAESDFVAQIGENIRVTGTFSYLGGFQALVIFYSFFAWSLLNREKYKLAVIVTLVTGYLSLLTGARNAVISFIILTIIMIYENKNTIKKHVTQIVGITSLICLLVIFMDMFKIVEKPLDNFEKRTTKLNKDGESSNRIYRQYLGAFMYHGEQPVFGAGLGSAYQGTNSVWGKSDIIKAYGYYEEEAERIVIEGGYFLYLIRIILFIIILSALQIKKISKWVLFILFVNGLLVYHTYMTLFIALGFIWVNQSKLTNLKNKKYSVPPIISYT
jgi:hypothetical protein